jgi:hypothetical protein
MLAGLQMGVKHYVENAKRHAAALAEACANR